MENILNNLMGKNSITERVGSNIDNLDMLVSTRLEKQSAETEDGIVNILTQTKAMLEKMSVQEFQILCRPMTAQLNNIENEDLTSRCNDLIIEGMEFVESCGSDTGNVFILSLMDVLRSKTDGFTQLLETFKAQEIQRKTSLLKISDAKSKIL